MAITFKKPIITRGGNPVKLYHIYEDYIHGAYEHDNKWYIGSWHITGYFLKTPDHKKQHITSLDLINDDGEWTIPSTNPRIVA